MKKVFSDEVARELGYQKYYPTLTEWMAYSAIAALVVIFLLALALGIYFLNQ